MQAIRGELRSLGVVYTPPAVTEPMARLALEPVLRGRSIEELSTLAICDPAIGEGAFLLAAVHVIREHLERAGMAPDAAAAQAARAVHGVDVDPRAVEAARLALGHARSRGAAATAGSGGGAQLQVADALALDWPAAFPEVFSRGGFDVVLGNPPYIRHEHLGAQKPRLRGFASYDGVADLYVYFIELAHRLARPGGRFCLITPNKWLTAAYGRSLRSHLATQASVEGVVDLGRTALFGDADAFPCVVWGTIGAPRDTPIQAVRLAAGAPVELHGVGAPHPRHRWRADPWHIDPPDDRALIDRLEARWAPLHALLPDRPSRGVVTGCNRAFVLDRAARDRLLAAEPAAAALIRPFVKGRDLRCWRPPEPERWILLVDRGTSLDELPGVVAHLAQFRAALEPRTGDPRGSGAGRKPGAYRWYELQDPVGPLVKARAPRLLYQDIQTGPVCCLDPDGSLVPDTTVWMLPTGDLFLLAVLSSPLYSWYARRRFPPALNGSVRPKAEYLRNLPIAAPSAALRALIAALVTRRIGDVESRGPGTSPVGSLGEAESRGVVPSPVGSLDHAADPAEAGDGLDAQIAGAVLDAYELTDAERQLITA